MMQTASIAVIVPFYNRRGTILDTLASIEAQTVRPSRVVLVDDGSTDDGWQLVQQWFARVEGYFQCRLERQENSGAAAARNRGLQLTGPLEYVAFLDSDDT